MPTHHCMPCRKCGVYCCLCHPCDCDHGLWETDTDLLGMSEHELRLEVRKLRQAIREHRDAQGHELCWYQPELWGLLPETVDPTPEVPPREEFLRCCAQYRDSLDRD